MDQQMKLDKQDFLESHLVKIAELTRRQSEYKKVVKATFVNKDAVAQSKQRSLAQQLLKERNDLRCRVWVATSGSNEKVNNRKLNNIKCHVECQEELATQITQLKVDIANTDGDTKRINREIYALNRKTTPEAQFQEHFARTRKKMQNLENELEVSKKHECALKADNAKLRSELLQILNERTIFNTSYTKLVQRLTRDKKYLVDLVEHAIGTYENCINVYEKMELLFKKDEREKEKCKEEMQQIMRELETDISTYDFLTVKNQKKTLADINPKELNRRENVRKKYIKKINLYNKVMRKIITYTKANKINGVIRKFKYHENLYYSYFNYANEMSYHITLLEHAVGRLFGNIINLQEENVNSLWEQTSKLKRLEDTLRAKQKHNLELSRKRLATDTHLDNFLQGMEDIFEICQADATPLLNLLDDHEHLHLSNVPRALKIIEKRIFNVTAAVFVSERLDVTYKNPEYTVQQVHKVCEWPTALNDIVLTQLCPECAEGDAFHIDDGGEGIANLITPQEAKKKLYEKVLQPEMQYRLHNISDCRLPQSRLLAAKRNI